LSTLVNQVQLDRGIIVSVMNVFVNIHPQYPQRIGLRIISDNKHIVVKAALLLSVFYKKMVT